MPLVPVLAKPVTGSLPTSAVYGQPPAALAVAPPYARQVSPLAPDSADLADVAAGSLDEMLVYAPPGTLERRRVLALALRALSPDGRLIALAPKDKGGSRLGAELAAFGCAVDETARKHHRICETGRPVVATGLDDAIAEGGPRRLDPSGLWTWPGVFSWDRLDAGSALLIGALPKLTGKGADFGCGIGVLSAAVLAASPGVTALAANDRDSRAVDCARRNLSDPRASVEWRDLIADAPQDGLDFVVMNPPFHEGGAEDRGLGLAFVKAAYRALRKGGVLWMVANRHLPYDQAVAGLFRETTRRAEARGFKVLEARK